MELLIDDEVRARVRTLLEGHDVRAGRFFRPDADFYNLLDTDDGLLKAAKDLCRWIGVKPHHLTATFGSKAATDDKPERIVVPEMYRLFPYQTGAVLALQVARYAVHSKLKEVAPHPEFVEKATIELGFGLVVLNGLHGKRPWRHHLWHVLHQNWHVRDNIQLQAYRPVDYAHALMNYAAEYRLAAETWLAYVNHTGRGLLPFRAKSSSGALAHALPKQELLHRKSAHRWWLHILLLAGLIGAIVALFLFVFAQRVVPQSEESIERFDRAQTLYSAFTLCEKTARDQQNVVDVNDFYAEQRLNATKSRCQSLRNEYNTAADAYNQTHY